MIMKNALLAMVMIAPAAWGADYAPFNVKTGQWEATTTTQSGGTLPIPPDMLAKMSPDQRAKMEAMMKAKNAQPSTRVSRHCVKKEDLNKPLFENDGERNCKTTLLASSSTVRQVRMDCEENNTKFGGTVRIEAASPENVKITGQMSATNAGGAMTINVNSSAKWVGATCTGKEE